MTIDLSIRDLKCYETKLKKGLTCNTFPFDWYTRKMFIYGYICTIFWLNKQLKGCNKSSAEAGILGFSKVLLVGS